MRHGPLLCLRLGYTWSLGLGYSRSWPTFSAFGGAARLRGTEARFLAVWAESSYLIVAELFRMSRGCTAAGYSGAVPSCLGRVQLPYRGLILPYVARLRN